MRCLKGFLIITLIVLFQPSFANTQTTQGETFNIDELENLLKPFKDQDTDVPHPYTKVLNHIGKTASFIAGKVDTNTIGTKISIYG